MNLKLASRKLGLIVSSGIFLAVFFQNCAPPKTKQSESVITADSAYSVTSKVDMKSLKKISLWDVESGVLLDIDPITGESRSFEGFGEVAGERHCLTSNDLASLNSVLSQAEVCEPIGDVEVSEEFQVCTQMYRYPYASLQLASREFRLGEQINGCEKSIDLCGEKAGQLAAWSQAILATLVTKKCN